jgi:hypothetical protein
VFNMPAQNPREYVGIRLSPAGLERVRELAAVECEGNVSQMIRKLLGEALAARDRRGR